MLPSVGSGFSLSEVALSPEPILYTGSERPDAVVIASPDGLREVQGRGDLEHLASGGIVIADESVAAELPGGRTLRLPLRRTLSPSMAALGGVIALVERTGILHKEALFQALEAIVGREAAAFRRAVETAWSLGA